MGRLSKTEVYAIKWLNFQNLSPQEIATTLKLSEKQVTKALEVESKDKKTVQDLITSKSSATKFENLFITESHNKKNKGVTIMTKEASEKADSDRSNTSNRTKSERNNNIIFRPKN